MSANYLVCTGLAKWLQDFPPVIKLSRLKQHPINKYWDFAQISWRVARPTEICLHLSLFVYDMMTKCSAAGVDLSHATVQFLEFIEEFLVNDVSLDLIVSHDILGIGQFLGSLIKDTAQSWSKLRPCIWKDSAQLSTNLAAIKDEAQCKANEMINDAVTKVSDMCKNTGELASSKIDILTAAFLETCERNLIIMRGMCKDNGVLLKSWLISNKVVRLLGCIFEILDSLLDFVSSFTAFSFDMPLEIGFDPFDDLAILPNVDIVRVRKKRRPVGQH